MKTYVVSGAFAYGEHRPGEKFTAKSTPALEAALAEGWVVEASPEPGAPEQQETVSKTSHEEEKE